MGKKKDSYIGRFGESIDFYTLNYRVQLVTEFVMSIIV